MTDSVDARIAELEAENARLRDTLESLTNALTLLMQDSDGVVGLHRNGDVATWSELTQGGRFEEWLISYDDASKMLAALEGK